MEPSESTLPFPWVNADITFYASPNDEEPFTYKSTLFLWVSLCFIGFMLFIFIGIGSVFIARTSIVQRRAESDAATFGGQATHGGAPKRVTTEIWISS
eukprot:TRINITY_DN4197_c0_g2_i1.p1 TRINITY_DN4197_c0_g2~~TRINITY_DN4197_c0_g2_i1.p1  ORF type:complete len:113 (+),score=22.97 TRINITY_DN4197_c0_g2_i1:46-339(+)